MHHNEEVRKWFAEDAQAEAVEDLEVASEAASMEVMLHFIQVMEAVTIHQPLLRTHSMQR